MTVKELIERLQFLIKEKYLSEDDFVLLLGTGNVKTDYIQSVCMPKVEIEYNPFEEKKGYCHIGFCSNSVQQQLPDSESKDSPSKPTP